MLKRVKATTRPKPKPPGRQAIDYKIFTRDDYKRYRLSRMKASNITTGTIKFIEDSWNKISKGYNFIIGVGKEEQLMFYSVQYFNEHVLNGKNKSKDLTLKLNLDTTEFERKLNKIGNKLEELKRLEIIRNLNKIKPIVPKDILEFEESLNRVKELL
ncbi:hypothetical protein NPD9_1704 [Clostridium botulinum]|uniref:hypothetical protein n=1 Tax=Clostridium botulinum TaxID=1491 RepID=UPI000FCB0980|nr:hypothetical protein [Clostridium botulinum]RUT55713.1 hypothetical protein NPD9_1704 [Clostridium botulinum]